MTDTAKLEEQIADKAGELERLEQELKETDKGERRRSLKRRIEAAEESLNASRKELFLEGGLS